MDDMIRCTSCRGTKKVAKLGGIIGDCNTCKGTGQIKAVDKPKPVEVIKDNPVVEIIEATSKVTPSSSEPETNTVSEDKPELIVTKRKVFKRKKSA